MTIYYVCLKCEKAMVFDWNSKTFKTTSKKEQTEHGCELEDHFIKTSKSEITEDKKIKSLHEIIGNVNNLL